jgi:uncharacterized tellurite resistance protein B-like protein
MAFSLPKESFLAVVAVAWADGLLRQNETQALLRAASQCGLSGEELAVVDAATRQGATLDAVDLAGLSEWQKGLTYALAYWLAKVDGVVNAQELEHLRQLGARTGLPELKLKAAQSAVFDITCLPEGHRPEKFDFGALATRLEAKLPSIVPQR